MVLCRISLLLHCCYQEYIGTLSVVKSLFPSPLGSSELSGLTAASRRELAIRSPVLSNPLTSTPHLHWQLGGSVSGLPVRWAKQRSTM